jgi:hypothetical protein
MRSGNRRSVAAQRQPQRRARMDAAAIDTRMSLVKIGAG